MDRSRSSQSKTVEELLDSFNVYEPAMQDASGPSNPTGPWHSREDDGFLCDSTSSSCYGATGGNELHDPADDERAIWDSILTDMTSSSVSDILDIPLPPSSSSLFSATESDSLGDDLASFCGGGEQRGHHLHHGASVNAAGMEQTIDGMQRLDLEEEISLREQDESHEEAQQAALSPHLYIPREEIFAKTPTKRKNRARGPTCWEFLARLLFDSRTNPSLIEWEDEDSLTFRLKNPEAIAKIWDSRKKVPKDVPYINFARALRHHYKEALIPIPDKQLVYRFGPSALPYLEWLRHSKR